MKSVKDYAKSLYGKSNQALFAECLDLYESSLELTPQEIEVMDSSITLEFDSDTQGFLNNPLQPQELAGQISEQLNLNVVTVLHAPIKELGLYTVRLVIQKTHLQLSFKDCKVWIVPSPITD